MDLAKYAKEHIRGLVISLIVILLLAGLIVYYNLRSGKLAKAMQDVHSINYQEDFKKLVKEFGKPVAENTERIYRIETANFKSGGFVSTLGAGMEAAKSNGKVIDTMPYGWTSLKTFWTNNPELAPIGIKGIKENDSVVAQSAGIKPFLIFPTFYAGLAATAEIMRLRGNDPGKWMSTNVNDPSYITYKQNVMSFTPSIVNSI